ncbi:CNPV228 N1R/p28-like protein [Canarypox virus]|uniref:CNPV228 N1R/p28-like protein n=1 Tax=Canarypox virus TaxID=44088 RepID=Q6VZB9_CNPV|nr:CNPV228 N1R/p28-like protein [Canarypox virus]AAR83574.1 CNPV228 N1R/p28-like protein [Canarypox virus]AWD84704.1 N1R/p28-like protein [Canarypox virus]
MDFSNLVTREIDERFCYIKYDTFELIMMKENNYVNATKLCKLGNKRFRDWIRLDGSKDLIKEVEYISNIWSIKSPRADLRGVILEVGTISKGKHQYEVAGSYVHPDLIPHIASWISPSFAIKVSKIINCYVSGKYEFKLKEREEEIRKRENKIDELMELLYEFNDKYDRDTLELKKLYREQRKHAKRMEEKYDRDTRELKEHNKELSNSVKRMEEKYDRDTRELKEHNKELSNSVKRMEEKYDRDTHELKTELKKIEERLKDKVINPSSPNKLHRLVILQNKRDPNSFKTLRVQTERLNQETNKYKNDYKVFFNAYEPNAVSCFNRLKERLLEQERVKINYNDFTLCDLENYGVRELYNDLNNLDLVRKYA